MRIRVTLAEDVAAAVNRLRRERGIGPSEALNELARAGLSRPTPSPRYVHQSYDMGLKVDVTNIGEALARLDEPD